MDEDDIGQFFITSIQRDLNKPMQKDVIWQMVAYSEHPTVTMENCGTGDKIHFAVGSPLSKEFIKLVPEKKE